MGKLFFLASSFGSPVKDQFSSNMCEGYDSNGHLAISWQLVWGCWGWIFCSNIQPSRSKFSLWKLPFLNCTLLELWSLSFSLMFEESGLSTSQIFISLPIYRHLPSNHCVVYPTKLHDDCKRNSISGTMREMNLMRILKTSSFFGFVFGFVFFFFFFLIGISVHNGHGVWKTLLLKDRHLIPFQLKPQRSL